MSARAVSRSEVFVDLVLPLASFLVAILADVAHADDKAEQ